MTSFLEKLKLVLTIVERENIHPYLENDKSNDLLAITLKDILIP